jgi:hypothetical protein
MARLRLIDHFVNRYEPGAENRNFALTRLSARKLRSSAIDMSFITKTRPDDCVAAGPCAAQRRSAFAVSTVKHQAFIAEASWANLI